METYLRFLRQTCKKCYDTNTDMNMALWRNRSTPLGGVTKSVTLLFNHPVRGLMLIINGSPISAYNNDDHCKWKKQKADKHHITLRNYNYIAIESTVAVQWETRGPWTMA